MISSQLQHDIDYPTKYEIKVQGWVDESWSDWLGGVAMVHEVDSDDMHITSLTATIVDQAALYGLLRRLYTLHVLLLSFRRVE
jgi:putative lipoic acid-binding regulatory protein